MSCARLMSAGISGNASFGSSGSSGSGANKNLIGYGIRLHKHYCEYWEKQSLKIEKEYKKALRDYTLSLQAIRKKNIAMETHSLKMAGMRS